MKAMLDIGGPVLTVLVISMGLLLAAVAAYRRWGRQVPTDLVPARQRE